MLAIAIFSFLATFALLVVVYQSVAGTRETVNRRMLAYIKNMPIDVAPLKSAPSADWRGLLIRLGRLISSTHKADAIDAKMQQAGIKLRGSEFLVLSIGLSVIVGLLTVILARGSFPVAIGAGVLVYLLFDSCVEQKIKTRMNDMNRQLGDALSLMANALRSGLSFLQAVEVISREMPNPIAEEFSRLLRELNLGVTTEDALRNLTNRVRNDDLELVVTTVLIHRQVGGNLAQILDANSSTIRERLQIKGEIKTLTAQGRLSGWVVGLLPLVMLAILSVLHRDFILLLFTDPLGHILLGIGVVMQVIGAFVISKIVNIDV